MAIKIFLDINVLIDFFDAKRGEHNQAVRLFTAIESGKVAGYVSESVLNTTVYILRKQFVPKKLREILEDLLSFMEFLPCTSGVYLNSLKLNASDIEDALLYQLALENDIDYFITENKKDFKKFSSTILPAISAKEFLEVDN